MKSLFTATNNALSNSKNERAIALNRLKKRRKVWLEVHLRIPAQSCHPFQTNAATHSILKLPLIPVNFATSWW